MIFHCSSIKKRYIVYLKFHFRVFKYNSRSADRFQIRTQILSPYNYLAVCARNIPYDLTDGRNRNMA